MKFSRRSLSPFFVAVGNSSLVTPLASTSIPSFAGGPIHRGKQKVKIFDFAVKNNRDYGNCQYIERAVDSLKESGRACLYSRWGLWRFFVKR